MDNAMVKRGIGAVVLAIIAALLLGYLLKDKSQERQDIVEQELSLPGAPEINIPSLTGSSDTTANGLRVIESEDKTKHTTNSVVSSATGATIKELNDTSSNVIKTTSNQGKTNNANPGFSFRPPKKNEEKLLVDNTTKTGTQTSLNSTSTESTSTKVVASTPTKKAKNSFKPTIEEEKKKVVKASSKVVNKKPAKKKKVEIAKNTTPTDQATSASLTGKYSIQLLATSSMTRANKLSKTMNSEGYQSFITKTSSNNKILYRVRVGGHKNRNSAIKAQEGMKKRYQKNFFVQNSLVVSN